MQSFQKLFIWNSNLGFSTHEILPFFTKELLLTMFDIWLVFLQPSCFFNQITCFPLPNRSFNIVRKDDKGNAWKLCFQFHFFAKYFVKIQFLQIWLVAVTTSQTVFTCSKSTWTGICGRYVINTCRNTCEVSQMFSEILQLVVFKRSSLQPRQLKFAKGSCCEYQGKLPNSIVNAVAASKYIHK